MQNFNVNSLIHFRQNEYQLRTSNNGQLNKIICSLFRDGEFINSREIKYGEEYETKLLALIKQFHKRRQSEIEQFFNLSQKIEKLESSELSNMLGLIFEKDNLHAEAIDEFSRAIKRNSDDSWAFNNLGKALQSEKKYEFAIKAFQKAIKISPGYADIYNNLGTVYFDVGACRNAVEQFEKAISLNPYYAEAYFNQGLTYILNQIEKEDYKLTLNYREDVKKCLEKAIRANPGYQNEHYKKGIKFLEAEKHNEALENFKIAKKHKEYFYLHIKYEYYLILLFCEEKDNYDTIWKYIKFLQALLKKYPGHADIYNDLGLAYCMLRNYINNQAIMNFEKALKINPDFKKAKRNLKLSNYEKTGSEIFLKALTSNYKSKGKISF